MSTISGLMQDVTLEEATTFGEPGNIATLSGLAATAAMAMTVSTASEIAACYKVPETLYHFTTLNAAEKILMEGAIKAGTRNFYGEGVYATGFNSSIMARIQGAASTETKIIIKNTTDFKPTPFPGTFRTPGTSVNIK